MWMRVIRSQLSQTWHAIQTDHSTWTHIIVVGVSKLEKIDTDGEVGAEIVTANLIIKYIVPVP
jgi:hypothetical protein